MWKRLILGILVFGAAAVGPPAQALTICADRGRIVDLLKEAHTEKLRGIGLQSPYEMVEVWSSDETGSWTILVSHADGHSCVLGSGLDFEWGLSNQDRDNEDPAS